MIPKACHGNRIRRCKAGTITGPVVGLRVVLAVVTILVTGCAGLTPRDSVPPVPAQTMPSPGSWRSDIAVGRPISPPAGMSREQAVAEITSRSVLLLGTPYRLGGSRPDEGLDCSGLIFHVMNEAFRIRFPRTSEEQAMVGVSIPRHEMAPGDLVFFNTNGRANSHVGVYLGETRFVHAPTSRGVVRIESLSQGYWSRRFDQARRVVAER